MGNKLIYFVSPKSGDKLVMSGNALISKSNENYPIITGIPRFVDSRNYAASFGLEWKLHAKTQLDSYTKTNISRNRLEGCLGFPIKELNGKTVFEAGCGAGRFTELMVNAGAFVHSIDLSEAVEVNFENIGRRNNYVIAQASLLAPPFPKESFDFAICLGVIQHTPSPEKSIEALWKMVKPGGQLIIDHYTWDISYLTKLSTLYRVFFKNISPKRAKIALDKLVDIFFPVHWAIRKYRPAQILLSRISPCLVYFDAYKELTKEQHYQFCRLDTFDHLTDRFKHMRTKNQIHKCLKLLGAKDIFIQKGGNGIEARAKKPIENKEE